jgi:hypothetical protein
MLEKNIMHGYGFQSGDDIPSGLVEKANYAAMFRELAERGCAENRQSYADRYDAVMRELYMRGAVGSAEIRIDMDKVGQVVEAAVQPAVNAMADFLDKMKNTKVSVTVE